MKRKLIPGPLLMRPDGSRCDLRGLFAAQNAFLCLGGPSAHSVPWSVLESTPAILVGINGSPLVGFTPQLYTACDDPRSFSEIIWKNPKIMKFVPFQNTLKPFKEIRDGKFCISKRLVRDCPNVFCFRLKSGFILKDFLTTADICWGNESKQEDELSNKGCRSTMMAAIKLLYYFGFSRIFLLGCDFHMVPGGKGLTYCFNQDKHKGGCVSNNRTYKILNNRLCALRPILEENNCQIINCTPNSRCTAFDYVSLEKAIDKVNSILPVSPQLSNLYL